MPIINSEPQGQNVWPPRELDLGFDQQIYRKPPAQPPQPAPEPFNPRGLVQAIEALELEIKRLAQAQAIQREAFRRVLEIPEGDLLALEKRVVEELYRPQTELTLANVQELIEKNLTEYGDGLVNAIQQILQHHGITPAETQQPAPRPSPKDPLGTAPDDFMEEGEEEAEEEPPPLDQAKPPAEAMDAFADQLEQGATEAPKPTPRKKKK